MVIAALVLTDDNNALGRDHRILELVPSYVRYFERLTKGYPVIMGRKTFESVGHILKSRKNIIVTRSEKYHSSKAKTCHNFKEALLACKNEKRVFVMGGPGIYKEALPYTKFIFRTSIMARFKSDAYFPEIDQGAFDLVSSKCIKADPKNRFDYCVEKWQRT
jgi:dihydrofolate reductase